VCLDWWGGPITRISAFNSRENVTTALARIAAALR
jgi:hypothetical protein